MLCCELLYLYTLLYFLQKIWKSHSILISTKIQLIKVLVWPVAAYGSRSWTLRKNKETRLDAFEMGLRKILRVSWTAKKTNEWIFNKAEVKRELLDTVKARKLAYYGHCLHQEETRELHVERDNARNNARCTQARKATCTNFLSGTWSPCTQSVFLD